LSGLITLTQKSYLLSGRTSLNDFVAADLLTATVVLGTVERLCLLLSPLVLVKLFRVRYACNRAVAVGFGGGTSVQLLALELTDKEFVVVRAFATVIWLCPAFKPLPL